MVGQKLHADQHMKRTFQFGLARGSACVALSDHDNRHLASYWSPEQ